MVNYKHKRGPIDWEKRSPSKTIPDQSMSIKEIIRRFVKGIPADVLQRDKIFVDQEDTDLEALSRLDPTDQAFKAQEMRSENEYLANRMKENERARQEERELEDQERENQKNERARSAGIETLDNTMPVDTNLNPRPLPNVGQGVKGGQQKQKQ